MTYRGVAVVLLVFASPAYAEVMDKELSVPDIWRATAYTVVLALGATLLHRWLLPLSFLAAIAFGPTFAWTEWYDELIGPAILCEAGSSYGVHANAAMLILVLAHAAGWVVASHRHRQRLERAGQWNPVRAKRTSLQSALFMGLLALLTGLAAFSGFSPGLGIWLSPPFLASIVFWFGALVFAGRKGEAP